MGIRKHRRSVAQPGSASGLGPEGREFESLHSDHFSLKYSSGCAHPVFAVVLAYLIAAMVAFASAITVGQAAFLAINVAIAD